jgi:ribosomal protein L21
MLGTLRCLMTAPRACILPKTINRAIPLSRALSTTKACVHLRPSSLLPSSSATTFSRAFSAQTRKRNARTNGYGIQATVDGPQEHLFNGAPIEMVIPPVEIERPTHPLRTDHPHPTIVAATHPDYDPVLNTFAVLDIATRQHKVLVGDVLMVASMMQTRAIGEEIVFETVLAIGTPHLTIVGRPTIPGCKVYVSVQEHTQTERVLAFKSRRRKSSKRLKGMKPKVTLLEVTRIEWEGETKPLE